MAEGKVPQDKRCSPIGKELEPEDKDMETDIKLHLEQFWNIIIRDVTYDNLLIFYPFSREQKRELIQMGKSGKRNEEVMECGLQMIEQMDNKPDKYQTLKDSLQDAGYDKIADTLGGDLVPGTGSFQRKIIDKHFQLICKNVDPMEILPILLKNKVINDKDFQLVRSTCTNQGPINGMVELLMVLPDKHLHWYLRFIEAVLETNSDIAEKIDLGLCKELKSKSMDSHSSLMYKYTSWIPIRNQMDHRDDRSRLHERGYEDVGTGIREHILEDYHEASVGVNNLSPPSKIAQDQSLIGSPDFKDILVDNENVQHGSVNQSVNQSVYQSVNQSVSIRGEYVTQSTDGNQMESLNFNSLLTGTAGDQSKSLNHHAQFQTRSLNQSSSNTAETIYSRGPGDGLPSASDESERSYSTRQDSSDETPLKTPYGSSREWSINGVQEVDRDNALDISSIESNARVPESTARMSSSTLGPRRSLEAYLRDNSHSPDMKVLPDKNMDMLKGNEAMNIQSQEPDPGPMSTEDEDIEDTDITLRGYQEELAGPAIQGKNVIIVAPTGSGKTRVALRIIQEHIRKQQGRGIAKVVFLVNQVALANQQSEECLKQLRCYKSKVISGETQRGRREYLKDFVDKRDILIVTAQVLLDSLVRKEIEGIHAFSLLVFDECHHTHANHTFNQIMGLYMALKFSRNPPVLPQIVGLTASVGVGKSRNEEKAMEHIKKLMANMDAEMICTVQNNMQELRSYVAIPDEETYAVSKRENDVFGETVRKLMNTIETMMSQSSVVKEMEEAKLFEKVMKSPAAKGCAQYEQWVSKLWKETAKLRSADARRFLNPCRTHLVHYNNALLIHNDARVQDALNYLEREMKTWREQARFMDENEKKLDRAFQKLHAFLSDKHSDNPKLKKLQEIIIKAYQRDPENSRGIVFVRTRELAKAIISWMKETDGLRALHPIQFLGQTPNADKGGMTKAEQDDVLKYFKDGKHKLIVATSVAEEGLDISKCNLVIRYDYVTNEIAMVQSRGRGRAKDSKYFVLAEEGSGMAEKEELNMIREIMMRKAIIKLQREIQEQPQKFKKDIHDLQDEAHLDHQLKSIGSRQRRLQPVGEFELQCIKCSRFICMSNDLKKVQGAHHVIVDSTLSQRVAYVKSETEECAVDVNQPIGKLSCRNCGENLGVIAIYRKLEFPVPKIEKFLIVDRNGRQTTKKRWKDIPWFIDDLRNNDFRNILEARSQNGSLDE